MKNKPAAIADLNIAVSISPSATSYLDLGYYEFLAGKNDLACAHFMQANQLDSSKAGPYLRKYCKN